MVGQPGVGFVGGNIRVIELADQVLQSDQAPSAPALRAIKQIAVFEGVTELPRGDTQLVQVVRHCAPRSGGWARTLVAGPHQARRGVGHAG
jgi:hypothetical protein